MPCFYFLLAAAVPVVGHDHPAVGIGAHGVGSNPFHILQSGVDDMALISVHRFQGHVALVLDHFRRNLMSQVVQALLPLETVVFRIYMDSYPLVAALVDGIIGELLDGVQSLTRRPIREPSFSPSRMTL